MSDTRFKIEHLDERETNTLADVNIIARGFEEFLTARLKPSRTLSLALTNLEQCVMWVQQGLRNGLKEEPKEGDSK